MADPVSAAILTVKGVVEIAKGLKDISQSFQEADYKAIDLSINNGTIKVNKKVTRIVGCNPAALAAILPGG